jgi:hypothetical protein
MKWLVIGLHILLLSWLAFQVGRRTENLKRIYWPALLSKLGAAISVGLIYMFYYEVGDTLTYFSDASLLATYFSEDAPGYLNFLFNHSGTEAVFAKLSFQDPRALLMVKIISVFCLISFSNYWVVASYFAFISFLGAWYLVRKIELYFPDLLPVAVIAFLFFPSVVFWSAGVIKESLAMASIFYLSGIFLTFWCGGKIKASEWFLIFASAWVLWNLKYYFAAVFFSVTLNSILFKFLAQRIVKPKTFLAEVSIWSASFVLPLIIVTRLHPNFAASKLFSVVTGNYQAFVDISSPEDLIHFPNLTPDFWSIFSNAPLALVSGLFRPFIWEANTLFQMLVAIENLFLLAGTICGLYFVRRVLTSPQRMLIFSCCVYIATLCIFITLSTPNFGTLSRYRVGYLPYFSFLLLCSPPVSNFLQRSFNRLVRK